MRTSRQKIIAKKKSISVTKRYSNHSLTSTTSTHGIICNEERNLSAKFNEDLGRTEKKVEINAINMTIRFRRNILTLISKSG